MYSRATSHPQVSSYSLDVQDNKAYPTIYRRHGGGRKPGNGDTADRTYSMEEAGWDKIDLDETTRRLTPKRAGTMSETSRESAVDAGPTFEGFPKHPKRVILRLRVNEFDGRNPTEFDRAIMAYLASAGRSVDELTQKIHHSHIEPLQPPEMKQRSFHIVLDIEKDMLSDPDLERVEHEVHRVHRAKNGELSSMTSWRQATFELIPDFCSQLALYCSFDIRHMELRDSVTMKESFRNRVNPDFPIFGLGLGNQFFAPSNTPFVEGSS
ncbi:conserved hypothetical protein [Histoplasma capsulatum H143]|uniref:Uncharacterized protein n=1 Tax=Ajellomyces capsulatus (strain H143) TaxID=544712 RepID=C6H218_AJECH|nr:conserved hypothetical protein [Histoplasma capsulatum H143]